MKLAHAFLAAIAAAAPLASPAAELVTPALPVTSGQHFECRVVNASATPQTLTVEAVQASGGTLAGPGALSLAPREAGGFAIPGPDGSVYCRFEVGESGAGLRASIDVFELMGDGMRLRAALPAQ